MTSGQPEAVVPVEFRASLDGGKDQGGMEDGTKDGDWAGLHPSGRSAALASRQQMYR